MASFKQLVSGNRRVNDERRRARCQFNATPSNKAVALRWGTFDGLARYQGELNRTRHVESLRVGVKDDLPHGSAAEYVQAL